jgi:hypothetical protein
MGFEARSAGASLDWDLRPYVDAHGTIPEPSRKALREAGEAFEKLQALDGRETDEAQRDEIEREVYDMFAIATSGRPSADELRELHESAPRVFFHFLGWLTQVFGPEASSSDSRR